VLEIFEMTGYGLAGVRFLVRMLEIFEMTGYGLAGVRFLVRMLEIFATPSSLRQTNIDDWKLSLVRMSEIRGNSPCGHETSCLVRDHFPCLYDYGYRSYSVFWTSKSRILIYLIITKESVF